MVTASQCYIIVLVVTYHQEAVPEVAVLYAADEGCHFLQRTVYETSAHEAAWEQPTIANSIRRDRSI